MSKKCILVYVAASESGEQVWSSDGPDQKRFGMGGGCSSQKLLKVDRLHPQKVVQICTPFNMRYISRSYNGSHGLFRFKSALKSSGNWTRSWPVESTRVAMKLRFVPLNNFFWICNWVFFLGKLIANDCQRLQDGIESLKRIIRVDGRCLVMKNPIVWTFQSVV